MAYPQLGEAYGLRESFLDLFEIADPEQAKGFLAHWCDKVLETGHYAFHKFVSTLKAHWFGIVAYFDCGRATNGILEGLNTKIQLAKRRARGMPNVGNFIAMIYFVCGKRQFDYPLKSL